MANIRSSPSGELVATETLPEGTYLGQPLVWNGVDYVPTDPSIPSRRFRLEELRDVGDQTGVALGIIAGNDVGITITSQHADDANLIQIQSGSQGSFGRIDLRRLSFLLTLDAFTLLEASGANAAAEMAFLGATPVPRQSITGATVQEQIDSIVEALVAFGLASDAR